MLEMTYIFFNTLYAYVSAEGSFSYKIFASNDI
jgi:hypothetical protein